MRSYLLINVFIISEINNKIYNLSISFGKNMFACCEKSVMMAKVKNQRFIRHGRTQPHMISPIIQTFSRTGFGMSLPIAEEAESWLRNDISESTTKPYESSVVSQFELKLGLWYRSAFSNNSSPGCGVVAACASVCNDSASVFFLPGVKGSDFEYWADIKCCAEILLAVIAVLCWNRSKCTTSALQYGLQAVLSWECFIS